VNANAVTVRIKDHRHAAKRRRQRLDAELDIVLSQARDGGIKILHFERGTTAVRIGARATDGQRIRTCLAREIFVAFFHPLPRIVLLGLPFIR
jgi:hypothetical protein